MKDDIQIGDTLKLIKVERVWSVHKIGMLYTVRGVNSKYLTVKIQGEEHNGLNYGIEKEYFEKVIFKNKGKYSII